MMKWLTGGGACAVAFACAPAFAEEAVKAADSVQKFAPPDTTASLLKVVVGLLFVLVAIFASAWAFRRFGGKAFMSNDSMQIIGGLSLGQRDRVVLLQVGKEQIVVGVSPGRLQTLHVLKEPVEVPENNQQASIMNRSFSDALKHWKKS